MKSTIDKELSRKLVYAAKNGNSSAFEDLYKLYEKKVYALALSIVKNEDDAKDVLQETFISAWKNLSKINNDAAFNTWIQRITMNHCYALLKKAKPDISLDDDENCIDLAELQEELMLPEVYSQRDDLRERLMKIVNSLSDVQRQTIQLYYYDEMSVEEIAQVMECSENTVKTRLYLARRAIKIEIEEKERKTGEKFFVAMLVGVPVIAFSAIFTREVEAATLPNVAASNIYYGVSTVIRGAGKEAAKKSVFGIGAKIIAGVVVASIITTGVLVTVKIIKNPNDVHELNDVEEPYDVEESRIVEKTNDIEESDIESTSTSESSEPRTDTNESIWNNDETKTFLDDVSKVTFTMSSGAGGWCKVFKINSDGTFEIKYSNADGYQQNTYICYVSESSGHIKKIKKTDDYTYSFVIEDAISKYTDGETWTTTDEFGSLYKYIASSDKPKNGTVCKVFLPGTDSKYLADTYIIHNQQFEYDFTNEHYSLYFEEDDCLYWGNIE